MILNSSKYVCSSVKVLFCMLLNKYTINNVKTQFVYFLYLSGRYVSRQFLNINLFPDSQIDGVTILYKDLYKYLSSIIQ